MKTYFLLLIFTLFVNITFSQEVRWTGTKDKYWDNPENWSSGKIPAKGDNVVIPKGTPECSFERHYTTQELSNVGTITNHGSLTIKDEAMKATQFVNSQSGKVYMSDHDGAWGCNADLNAKQFTNNGEISGKKINISGSDNFENTGTISSVGHLSIDGFMQINNGTGGTLTSSSVYCHNSKDELTVGTKSSVNNDGTINATNKISVLTDNYNNEGNGIAKAGAEVGISATNVNIDGTVCCTPNTSAYPYTFDTDGGNVSIYGKNVNIDGTAYAGSSINGSGGNIEIGAKNEININGTVNGGSSIQCGGGNVTINSESTVNISQTGNVEGGFTGASAFGTPAGKVEVKATTVNNKGAVSSGDSPGGSSGGSLKKNAFYGKTNHPDNVNYELYFGRVTIAADTIYMSGDSCRVEADTLTFVFSYMSMKDVSQYCALWGDADVVFRGTQNATIDLSENNAAGSISIGYGAIQFYCDNIIPPAEGLGNICDVAPHVYPSQEYFNCSVTSKSITDTAGTSGSFYLQLSNTGTVAKSFYYNITSKLNWVAQTTGSTTQIAPFDLDSILIHYTIPLADTSLTDTLDVVVSVDGEQIATGHSYITSIEPGTVIPVELVSFDADINNSFITLKWITVTETNNKGFEIQKRDLIYDESWKALDFINGAGTTTISQKYLYVDKNIQPGEKYLYRLKQVDFDGSFKYSDEIEIKVANPDKFLLSQNYPNPFNPLTTISFSLPATSKVALEIYNSLGEKCTTLINGTEEAGNYKVEWNTNGFSSGIYFYRIYARAIENNEDYVAVKKMIVVK